MYMYWRAYFSQQRSVPVCVLGLPSSSSPVKHNPVCKIRSANHCLPRKDATFKGQSVKKNFRVLFLLSVNFRNTPGKPFKVFYLVFTSALCQFL